MRRTILNSIAATVVLACVSGTQADVVIETMPVGNAGNANDDTGYGGVDYTYSIGKYEVTNSQYATFLNSAADVGDPNGLYNLNMNSGWNDIGGISRSGSGMGGDPWVYTARPNRGNRPVNYVSWYDTLRFANWMHNGQGSSSTENGAYDMSQDFTSPGSPVRNAGATWVLPTENEWYKAAYYDPNKAGGAGYWDYPTQSDIAPTSEPPAGTDLTNGSANYYSGGYVDPMYYTTDVGAYNAKPSDSAYGTFDQGGNLYEWNEVDIVGDGSSRGLRGGSFPGADTIALHVTHRGGFYPSEENHFFGFRVASIPEPATLSLLALGGLVVLRRRP